MLWSDGYVNEVGYTYGYYRDLSPINLELALLYQNILAPRRRPLKYLELGFGQGLSLNIHAAAMDGSFWGTDFNPAHAANARELAQASGGDAHIFDDSFAELAARSDLPDFDVIAFHGIWSWISEANRKVVVDIIRRKLAPGGVVFMGYNVLPGWAPIVPLRRLLRLHSELADHAETGIGARIDKAMTFAQEVNDVGAAYFRAQPGAASWLKTMGAQDKSYLAHEYFNADWNPMTFADVARELEAAKLSFGASANLLDHWDMLNFSPEQQALLSRIDHQVMRETVRDYCVNRQFRRDVWVKGYRKLASPEQAEAMKAFRFALTIAADAVSFTVEGTHSSANLPAELYRPVVDALSANGYAPKTLRELADLLPAVAFSTLAQAVVMLTGTGAVTAVQSDSEAKAAISRTDALNSHLLERAVVGETVPFLASPVSGGGVLVPGLEQWFIRAIKAGLNTPEAWGAEAARVMALRGEGLINSDRTLRSPEDTLAELTGRARDFAGTRLTILKALMVV